MQEEVKSDVIPSFVVVKVCEHDPRASAAHAHPDRVLAARQPRGRCLCSHPLELTVQTTPLIAHVSEMIAARVCSGQPVVLELDGFLLLSDSPSSILRDGDILDVVAASAGGVALKKPSSSSSSSSVIVHAVPREKRKPSDDGDDDDDQVPTHVSAGKKQKVDDVEEVQKQQKKKQQKQQPSAEKIAPVADGVARKAKEGDDSQKAAAKDHKRSKPAPVRVTKYVNKHRAYESSFAKLLI